jgi:hypothetical protein
MPINFKGVPVRDDIRGDPGDAWTLIDPVKDIYEWTPASGGGGSGGTYVFDQPTASTTWVINHNLLYYPSVTIVDSAGQEIVGEVSYATINQVIVTVNPAVAGKAYLS